MKIIVDKIPKMKNQCLFAVYENKNYHCDIKKDCDDDICSFYNGECPYLREKRDE